MKAKTLILLVIIVAAILAAVLTMKPAQRTEMASVGMVTPDFELFDLNRSKSSLSDMKGSVVFVNFWSTWCTSCVDELPSIEQMHRNFAGSPSFRVVTILYKDDLNRALNYMKQNGFTFPVYLNPDESAAKIFGITGIPETFIIDKKGVLRHKVIGPADWDNPHALKFFESLISES